MAAISSRSKTTSYKNTAFGILPRSKVVTLEKEGIKRGLQYILKLSNKRPSITSQVIRDVHQISFGFVFPDWAGKFRSVDVEVGEYKPPHYSRVPEMIRNLCDDLQERLRHVSLPKFQEKFLADVISLFAWFQHRFVWIHPFNDYNGRTARLLTNLLLLNLGLPVLEIKADSGRDRKRYIAAMEKADKHDFAELERLLAAALKESLSKL